MLTPLLASIASVCNAPPHRKLRPDLRARVLACARACMCAHMCARACRPACGRARVYTCCCACGCACRSACVLVRTCVRASRYMQRMCRCMCGGACVRVRVRRWHAHHCVGTCGRACAHVPVYARARMLAGAFWAHGEARSRTEREWVAWKVYASSKLPLTTLLPHCAAKACTARSHCASDPMRRRLCT
jgi:hypothetical protein